MNRFVIFSCLIFCVFCVGCETVEKAGHSAGDVVGKTTDTFGSVTEGALDGYVGETTSEENPYGR